MAQRCEGYHQRVISGPLLLARALLANVRFAVLQIGVIALAATVGIALRQLPDYALQNAGDYANDPAVRQAYQLWVQQLWADKDLLIKQVMGSEKHG